jgi:hypothetical protein
MYTSLVVYLPEDDTSQLGGSYTIAAGGTEHLLVREIPGTYHRITELIADGQAALPHEGRLMGIERQGSYLCQHLLH